MKKSILLGMIAFTSLNLVSCGKINKIKNSITKLIGKSTKEELESVDAGASTGSETINDEQLKGFMLGGIYFIHGWGGKAAFDKMLVDATDKNEIVKGNKELLEFPFKPTEAEGSKEILASAWDIHNKEELIKTIDKLKKDTEAKHLAWNYARLVNNACIGYSAGYITQEEAKKHIAETLPLAQIMFKNWDEYFADFIAGRLEWDAEENEDQRAFTELSKTITQGGENNIYKLIPLKSN